MPLVSRIMIRCALLYLVGGALIGGIMLFSKSTGLFPWIWVLIQVHIEMLIFGWIIQFTLGTGYWMLPRLIEGKPRGDEKAAYFIPLLLNLGILIMITGYIFYPDPDLRIIGRISEAATVPVFLILHWRRVSKQLQSK